MKLDASFRWHDGIGGAGSLDIFADRPVWALIAEQ